MIIIVGASVSDVKLVIRWFRYAVTSCTEALLCPSTKRNFR